MKKNYSGLLYFYIHFVTEIICFYYLSKMVGYQLAFIMPLIYDGLAFVPQSLFGYLSDKYSKIPMSIIGAILLLVAIILYSLNAYWLISLTIICIGNALIHVNGAEVTLRSAKGKLSPSAIFVSGGSFGVITGKLLGKVINHSLIFIPLILSMIPLIIIAENYRKKSSKDSCKSFNYQNSKIKPEYIILLMVLIVIARGFIGYGIPTAWNKTTLQTIALFCIMGVGKGLGGILSDKYGVRKIGIYSTLLAIPFLCFGNHFMYISLIGVMLFSMTMSITLALLTSVLPKTPGLAFGLTTIGLFLGTLPIFFFKITSVLTNSILIVIISLVCAYIMAKVIRKD